MIQDHEQVTRMNENTQPDNVINEQKDGEAKVSGKRRVLLKGALGVAPAVLTLRSGAAFALDSTGMCVKKAKDYAAEVQPPVLTNVDDVWLRKEVYCRELTQETNGGIAEFTVYNESNTATTGWRHQDYTGSGDTGEVGLYKEASSGRMVKEGTSNPQYSYSTTTPCYVLVQVDENGNLVVDGNGNFVYGKDVSGYPYITDSCWSSVAVGAVEG